MNVISEYMYLNFYFNHSKAVYCTNMHNTVFFSCGLTEAFEILKNKTEVRQKQWNSANYASKKPLEVRKVILKAGEKQWLISL